MVLLFLTPMSLLRKVRQRNNSCPRQVSSLRPDPSTVDVIHLDGDDEIVQVLLDFLSV